MARSTGLLLAVAATALLLARTASASYWTATSYFVIRETTSVWTEYTETYTYTDFFPLSPDVTPTVTAEADVYSAYTYTDDYSDLEIIEIYLNDGAVPEEDIITEEDYYDDDYDDSYYDPYTYYVVPITYTAPESCATPFTVETYTIIDVPSEVADQLNPISTATSVYTYEYGDSFTEYTAFLEPSAVPDTVIATTTDYIYSYYIADCRNPTATDDSYYGDNFGNDNGNGSDNDDDDDDIFGGGSTGGTGNNGPNTFICVGMCNRMPVWAIVIAAVLPAIFLLGFFESYFWFRRLMIGRSALRFGTGCWIVLILPTLCFTRITPARDATAQSALREQWKSVSFGKALGLWFRWGFRHRYPVELLGVHPNYSNPSAAAGGVPQNGHMSQMPPPQGGYVYYAPGAAPANGSYPPQAKYPSGMPENGGGPPPGMVPYYPQYPPQAHQAQQLQQQQYRQSGLQPHAQPSPHNSPSPISGSPSVPPQATVSPQPPSPEQGEREVTAAPPTPPAGPALSAPAPAVEPVPTTPPPTGPPQHPPPPAPQ